MKKILFLFILCIFSLSVIAHQPRTPSDGLVFVENPEISQAFYSELIGEPHVYEINMDEEFLLYVGLLVPAIEGIEKDVSARITLNGEEFHFLNASESDWPEFYESFAGDLYYWGPELGANEPLETPKGITGAPGKYQITVFSPDNQGKYVFVVGENEEFPLAEMWNALVKMPEIKRYFGKSILTSFFNKVGIFLFMTLVIIALLIAGLVFRVRKIKK